MLEDDDRGGRERGGSGGGGSPAGHMSAPLPASLPLAAAAGGADPPLFGGGEEGLVVGLQASGLPADFIVDRGVYTGCPVISS